MAQLVLSTYHWITQRDWVIAEITQEIVKLLDGKSTGCFILTLDGPMGSEEVESYTKKSG